MIIIFQLSSQTLPRGDRQGEVLGPMCHNHQPAEVRDDNDDYSDDDDDDDDDDNDVSQSSTS